MSLESYTTAIRPVAAMAQRNRWAIVMLLIASVLVVASCAPVVARTRTVAKDPTLQFRTPSPRVNPATTTPATVTPVPTTEVPQDPRTAAVLELIRQLPLAEVNRDSGDETHADQQEAFSPESSLPSDQVISTLFEAILVALEDQGESDTVSASELATLFQAILAGLARGGDIDEQTSSGDLKELFIAHLEEASAAQTQESGGDSTTLIDLTLQALVGASTPTPTPTVSPESDDDTDPQATPTPIDVDALEPIVDLRLLPADIQVSPGDTFTLIAQVEPNGQPVLTAQAGVSYDPFYLEAISVQLSPTSLLQETFTGDDQFDNETGIASIGADYIWDGDPPTTSFTLGTFTFRVREGIDFTDSVVELLADRDIPSWAMYGTTDLTDELFSATISIVAPTP